MTGTTVTFGGALGASVWLVVMIGSADALAPPPAAPEVRDDSAAEVHTAWVEEVVDESRLRWEPCDVRRMGEAYWRTELYIAGIRYGMVHGEATEAMLVEPRHEARALHLALERCDPRWTEKVRSPWDHSGWPGSSFE